MTGEEPPVTPARQRRAERRRATYDEMVSLARDALREGRPVSLRAIAAEMGMTAPALYRYVDSHAALQDALVEAIFGEVIARLEEAASHWPGDRHGHRLVSSLYAFRDWALSRPEEFRLVFGEPRTPEGGPRSLGGQVPHSIQFVRHFISCLADMYAVGTFEAAGDDEVPASAVPTLKCAAEAYAGPGGIDAPLGLWWRAMCDWVLLCGVIRMEVDRMPGESLISDGAIFREALTLCATTAGVSTEDLLETMGESLPA